MLSGWLDEVFPAELTSIYMDVEDPAPEEEMGQPDEWRPLSEVYRGLTTKIVAGDSIQLGADCVGQGEVGDCYCKLHLMLTLC